VGCVVGIVGEACGGEWDENGDVEDEVEKEMSTS
jgi:hypothetical protein